ncbi:MAG TPA: kelch repeat-containing protein, partial [Chloroflexia bacterium]|nr:kelch repeat-containing protein [Chloroflexia bacterium]
MERKQFGWLCFVAFLAVLLLAGTFALDNAPAGARRSLAGPLQGTPTPTPSCGQPILGPWAVKSPLPFAAHGVDVASDGNYVYAIGGYNYTPTVFSTTLRYSPTTDTWTALAPVPDAHGLGVAVYAGNGKIYDFGGTNGSTEVNITRIYDIASNTWSIGAPMPGPLSDQGAGYSNGTIYLAGGYSGNNRTQETWAYNIAGNSWNANLAPLPQPVGAPGAGVINSKLYLAGGMNNSGTVLNTLYVYNIGANTWAAHTVLPQAANAPGSAVAAGRLWIFGGTSPGGDLTATQVYDPSADSWSGGPTLNVARWALGGAAAGLDIVAVGGWNNVPSERNTVEVAHVNPGSSCPSATPTGTPTLVAPSATATQTPAPGTAT